MKSITFNIPGINCNHCVHTIKNELSEMEGVVEVLGDIQAKKVTVQYNDPATPENMKKLLAEINYPVSETQ